MRQSFIGLVLGFLMAASLAVAADEAADKATEKKAEKAPAFVKTAHVVTIGGQEIGYEARAGKLTLKDGAGKNRADVFYVAYLRDGVADPATRPITFCFNGGPGSSSVWLHLGAFGPRKVKLKADGTALPPPGAVEDNPQSLLDVTDLVFIDPVSTGYSRPAEGVAAKDFHGYDEDLDSVADFIRLYVTTFSRWGSPKFLAGESYGTIRASGLANRLQNKYGMYLNGAILVSTVLDFRTLSSAPGNDLPYVTFLPTYAATAWFHKKLPEKLQEMPLAELAEEVRIYAESTYAQALLQGSRLSATERSKIVAQVAAYTALPETVIESNDLRVSMGRFARELLREDRRIVGRFDGRYLGMDNDWGNDSFSYDPSFTVIHGPISTTLNDYLRRELNYESELPYEILSGKVHPWNYGSFKNRYLNVSGELRNAVTVNPALRVFVASGYYDLATPFAGADYSVAHLGLPAELRDNVVTEYYEGGHMMYLRAQCLEKLRRDLVTFIANSTTP